MMQNNISNPPAIVLTIAGSDSIAGGGIQADLATFNEYNLFGVSAITSIVTVMPTNFDIHAEDAILLAAQLESIQTNFTLAGVKLGLIPDLEQMAVVLNFLQKLEKSIPIVVDPVLVFKEAHAPQMDAIRTFYLDHLFPLATVITPNLVEAEMLTQQKIKSPADLVHSAQVLKRNGAKNIVVKGGRRLDSKQALDVLVTERNEVEILSDPIILNNFNNGAGCTFSAAILSELVKKHNIIPAVQQAKIFVKNGISHGIAIKNNLGNVWQGANRHV